MNLEFMKNNIPVRIARALFSSDSFIYFFKFYEISFEFKVYLYLPDATAVVLPPPMMQQIVYSLGYTVSVVHKIQLLVAPNKRNIKLTLETPYIYINLYNNIYINIYQLRYEKCFSLCQIHFKLVITCIINTSYINNFQDLIFIRCTVTRK